MYKNLSEKYIAEKYEDFHGQDAAIIEIKKFLAEFPKRRGIILHGPAGTGKTSLALAAAKENNLEILELNASDLRNRLKLEQIVKPATEQKSLFKAGKIILMDEVDGVTGTDIGGIPELVRLVTMTNYPLVMTCNDVWQSKLSPLRAKCKIIEMKALSTLSILEILKKISGKEGINKNISFLSQISLKSQGDVRAAINDLEILARDKTTGQFKGVVAKLGNFEQSFLILH